MDHRLLYYLWKNDDIDKNSAVYKKWTYRNCQPKTHITSIIDLINVSHSSGRYMV